MNGLENYLYIKRERDVFRVVAIVFDLLLHVCGIAAVGLVISRNTRADGETLFSSLVEAFVIGGGEMGTGAYEAHVSLQHIKYLRKLVYGQAAEDPANGGYSGIVFSGIDRTVGVAYLLGVYTHGA